MNTTESVGIVIGHPGVLIRLGFSELVRRLDNAHLSASESTEAATIRAVQQHQPGLLVLAPRFSTGVLQAVEASRVLILSGQAHPGAVPGSLRSCAFCSETGSEEGLRDLLQALVDCGRPHAIPELCDQCPMRSSLEPAALPLSERERQIFDLIAGGLPTRSIAEQLALSPRTVESYRENIKHKLGLASSVEVVEAAMLWKHGLDLPASASSA